jgi:hypothetical protein
VSLTSFEGLYPLGSIACRQHNRLALKLQEIESDIVIRDACKKISKARPEIPLWTIHDSISTIEGYENIVKDYLKEAVYQRIGLVSPLKTKYWCPENEDLKMAA